MTAPERGPATLSCELARRVGTGFGVLLAASRSRCRPAERRPDLYAPCRMVQDAGLQPLRSGCGLPIDA